jgi:NADH pyrophosphatase NudC (nudix superfamily)
MFIVNVEGAIFKDNRWLIIQRSQKESHAGGLLSLVGGKIEFEGNSTDVLERTVRREIHEEVGITVKANLTYIQSTSFIADDNSPVIDVVFLCEYDSGEAHARSLDEVENVFWMTYEEIIHHPKSPPWLKGSIKRVESHRKMR